MPPVVTYKCAKCGMRRESYEAAEKCEEAHLTAVSVREVEYVLGAYPYRVELTFTDGKAVEYVADHGVYLNGVGYEKDKDEGNDKRHKGT